MTEPEVLGQGDERAPRRYGSLLAGAAAVALLAIGVAGAMRSPEREPAARPRPTPTTSSFPSGWTSYPSEEPFATYVSAVRPSPDEPTPLLLSGGIPLLLADTGGEVVAYELLGGPSYAPVLLGLCRADGSLLAADDEYAYLNGLPSSRHLAPLRRYPVRDAPQADHVEIGLEPESVPTGGYVEFEPACEPDDLLYPGLPEPVESLAAAGSAYVLMDGRYVVTSETRAFCPVSADGDCRSAGWEEYGPDAALPPWDLAGSYTWQGTFLVHADPLDGSLTVARTRESRLVRRERVGVSVRVGWAESAYERGGALHLRFNPVRTNDFTADDDSPEGEPRTLPKWYERFTDDLGGLRDLVLAPGAEVHLPSITGIGRPRGTAEVLRSYLATATPYEDPPLWLVLDAKGRVIRVVGEAVEGVRR